MEIEGYIDYAKENAKDIIAVGCNPDRTFIYTNLNYMGAHIYINVIRVLAVRSFTELRPRR